MAFAHVRVSCDGSKQSPLVGIRYKKITENYDLCHNEFMKLSASEKSNYIAMSIPQCCSEVLNPRKLVMRSQCVRKNDVFLLVQDEGGIPGNSQLKEMEDKFLDLFAKYAHTSHIMSHCLVPQYVRMPPLPLMFRCTGLVITTYSRYL